MSLSYSLPTTGNPNSTEDPLIRTALGDIKTESNAQHATGGHTLGWLAPGTSGQIIVCNGSGVPTYVTGSNFSMSSAGALTGVTDTALASPNNSAYRMIFTAGGFFGRDVSAGTYILGTQYQSAGVSQSIFPNAQGAASPEITTWNPIFYFDDADSTVAGLTQKLRLRAQVMCNATQAAITFTFGLYPVTVAGGVDNLTVTLGTVVTSSTVAIASPSASTVTSGVNSDFTVPSDGAYALGVVTSAQLTNNSAVSLHAQLQSRNV